MASAVGQPPVDPIPAEDAGTVAPAGHPVARRMQAADVAAFVWVRRQERHFPAATPHLQRMSRFGEHGLGWVAVGAAGALVDRPRRADWLRGAASVFVAHWGAVAVKNLIRRERPLLDDLPALVATPTSLSFPSAHAASAVCAAGAYRRLLPRGPLYATVALMAVTRPYLGAHYPSDVAAGALLGLLVARTLGP